MEVLLIFSQETKKVLNGSKDLPTRYRGICYSNGMPILFVSELRPNLHKNNRTGVVFHSFLV